MPTNNAEQSITQDSMTKKHEDAFILGGEDLEMHRIDQRLHEVGAIVLGEMTTWEEADITHRSVQIEEAQNQGYTPVLIEHRGADDVIGIEHIDHHGQNTHRDASILQVLSRLGVEPNFVDNIIGANDSEYIPGMEAFLDSQYKDRFINKRVKSGVDQTTAESRYQAVRTRIIEGVRRKDREAQGVTEQDELEAEEAIRNMEDRNGLKVVSLKGHRTSPVNDRLFQTWKDGKENLVVVCAADEEQKEVWFFGPGDISKETLEHFKDLKKERIAAIPDEPERKGIYHTVGGGLGFGETDAIARCLVVASDPEEVIVYVLELEEKRNAQNE